MTASPTLSPVATPSRSPRYGLMNARGEYFCHPYRWGGQWLEWDHSAHDAHEWVAREACEAAAKTWELIHGEKLVVVLL